MFGSFRIGGALHVFKIEVEMLKIRVSSKVWVDCHCYDLVNHGIRVVV